MRPEFKSETRPQTRLPKRSIEWGGNAINVYENREGLITLDALNALAEKSKTEHGAESKRVLLVDFKTSEKVPENEDYSFQNFQNLGLHRLAGYLQDYGVPVTIVHHENFRRDPEQMARVLASADIVGVSNLTAQVEEAYRFCTVVKQRFGDQKTVVGGGEHYLGFDAILTDREHTGIDACCIGQGELPMLALALGQPLETIGSMAYRRTSQDRITIVQNERFERLTDVATEKEKGELGILNTRQALPFSKEEISGPPPFNELNGLPNFAFDGTFTTQTGSGCLYGCDFCPSKLFFGARYEANLGAAKQEILTFKRQHPELKEVFLTFADAMLNPDEKHLRSVIDFMTEANKEGGPNISWFAYLSAPKRKKAETIEAWRAKWDGILAKMAAAGCIMGAVGVEEVIYDRNKTHHKGQDVDTASEFIDLVGKHMLTRTLLILGAPEHFSIDRRKTLKGEKELAQYATDRDLIKGEILEYMRKHPQALYRMNPWTLVYGTENYQKYTDTLSINPSDPAELKLLDHLHSVIDPEKMYEHLKIPPEKRWVKDREAWFVLMEDVMEACLASTEYREYVETLRDKETNGKKGLLYAIAKKFNDNVLAQITRNREQRRAFIK